VQNKNIIERNRRRLHICTAITKYVLSATLEFVCFPDVQITLGFVLQYYLNMR